MTHFYRLPLCGCFSFGHQAGWDVIEMKAFANKWLLPAADVDDVRTIFVYLFLACFLLPQKQTSPYERMNARLNYVIESIARRQSTVHLTAKSKEFFSSKFIVCFDNLQSTVLLFPLHMVESETEKDENCSDEDLSMCIWYLLIIKICAHAEIDRISEGKQ